MEPTTKSATRLQSDFATLVTRRRATAHFLSTPVPDEILERILELASFAPSGFNLQPWRFIVVRDPANRKLLSEAAKRQTKVEQAPVMIIACGDTESWRNDLREVLRMGAELGSIGDPKTAESLRRDAEQYLRSVDMNVWVTRQTMIAFTILMLAAESYGLNTTPIESFWDDQVRKSFAIPPQLRIVALLAMGYGAPPEKAFGGRFQLDSIAFEESFGHPLRFNVR